MNKKVLSLCAIASIAVAIFSCTKKEDDKETTTTTTGTTATTATTSTTSTSSTTTTPGLQYNQLKIDTSIVNYTVINCGNATGGIYVMTAGQTDEMTNNFTASFGKQPGFSKDYTITTTAPAANNGTNIQLKAKLDALTFTAASGKVAAFVTVDSNGITFKDVPFTNGDSTLKISGFIKCN
jgi:hypothetical protein